MTENRLEISGRLTGKLLIAMPDMMDSRFEQSVIFVCSHTEDGAMGLILNYTAQGVVLGDVLEQLEIEVPDRIAQYPVHVGGPVEDARGFVLHSNDFQSNLQTLNIDDDFAMTVTLDVLEEICNAEGPRKFQLMLGYAGWGAGQLESEIRCNAWLVCDATPELVFDVENQEKWLRAMKTLGIDPLVLSSTAGRA